MTLKSWKKFFLTTRVRKIDFYFFILIFLLLYFCIFLLLLKLHLLTLFSPLLRQPFISFSLHSPNFLLFSSLNASILLWCLNALESFVFLITAAFVDFTINCSNLSFYIRSICSFWSFLCCFLDDWINLMICSSFKSIFTSKVGIYSLSDDSIKKHLTSPPL